MGAAREAHVAARGATCRGAASGARAIGQPTEASQFDLSAGGALWFAGGAYRYDRLPFVTSHRKRKKQAKARGLTVPGLELAELLEEVLESLRWLQVLGYSNQYLLERRTDLDQAERDRIMEAATRVVDKDARLKDWRARLARIKSRLQEVEGVAKGDPPEAAPAPEKADPAPSEKETDGGA